MRRYSFCRVPLISQRHNSKRLALKPNVATKTERIKNVEGRHNREYKYPFEIPTLIANQRIMIKFDDNDVLILKSMNGGAFTSEDGDKSASLVYPGAPPGPQNSIISKWTA